MLKKVTQLISKRMPKPLVMAVMLQCATMRKMMKRTTRIDTKMLQQVPILRLLWCGWGRSGSVRAFWGNEGRTYVRDSGARAAGKRMGRGTRRRRV